MNTHRINMMTRRFAVGVALGLFAVATAPASHAQTAIKFSLDWKYEGPSSPFLVAIDKGYYKAEGLDVTIDTGAGSVEPLNRLASGSYDMAFGDINSLIKFLDKNRGTKIKAVFMLYNNPPFAVVGRKSKGVNTPKDLEGRKLGAPAADGAFAQWPIFVAANKIDASKVQIQNIGFPVREPMLISGDVDAITGFAFSSYLNVAKNVPKGDATVFLMSDYGVKLYGNAIMVHPRFAAEKPEAVKGFLRAFLKGLKDVVANPDAAMASVLPRNPVAKHADELERLNYALDKNIVTDEVKANGFGGIDVNRMSVAIDQLATTYAFEGKPTVDDIFDGSFLPAAATRAAK
jgi:NitT/TauT family transport system substrate-binding protein